MSISARVAGEELKDGMNARFGSAYFEVALLDADGVTYDPSNTDAQNATFLTDNEVTATNAGYARQVIGYAATPSGAYTDDGVALPQRTAVFEHNGTSNTYNFTHMALVWGSGNVNAGGTATAAPNSADNGTYTNLTTSTGGSGSGATIDLVVTNGGAATTDYAITINKAGRGYAVDDVISVANADLVSAGVNPGNTNALSFTITSVHTATDAGKIFSVAQTDGQVTLSNGNSAAFYINMKEFGFYSV